MNTHRSNASSSNRLARSRWLNLALAALLSLPPIAVAVWHTVSARSLDAHTVAAPLTLIVVNTTGDGDNVDANAGCDTDAGTPGEQCTLRAAIQRANALAGDDQITFNISTTQLNCDAGTGACIINLTKALPELSTNVAFTGPGSDKLTVRRNTGGDYRIFRVTFASAVSFSAMTIKDGKPEGTSPGGGIANAVSATVHVTNCIITSNSAANGGAIANQSTGTLNVTNSAILDNDATIAGGGIHNGFTGTLNVMNSKIGKNSVTNAGGKGGGIYVESGTASVTNSVIHGNLATASTGSGGGIFNEAGTLNVSNSTIALNDSENTIGVGIRGPARVKSTIIALNGSNPGVPTTDVTGGHTSEGFNLIGKGGNTDYTQPTDQTGTGFAPLDPEFDLTNNANGVFIPLCGSPLLDKGTSASLSGPLTTDVRGAGFPRTIDDPLLPNAIGGDGTDIGAFERPACPQFTFTVNTTADTDDMNPGDAACDSDVATGSQCTLRAAIRETNALNGAHLVNFSIPASDPGFDATGRHTINLTGALPAILSDLTISGPGPNKLTVRRNSGGLYRIFTVTGPDFVTISGLTISNAFSHSSGGGISHAGQNTLTINDCVLSDNRAENGGGAIASAPISPHALNVTNSTFIGNSASLSPNVGTGGAIFTFGNLNITNCTFRENAAHSGGAIYGLGGITATFASTITDSTFSVNSASSSGGGVNFKAFDASTLTITNSTFSGNTADPPVNEGGGGAIYHNGNSGTLSVINSTITGNLSGLRGGGVFNDLGTLKITNTTFSNNDSSLEGGGIFVKAGTVQVKSSIVAANNGGGFGFGHHDVSGAFTSAGFNLIGKSDGSTGFTNGVNNDQVGTIAAHLDPKLDPLGLQNNGGPTKTIALLSDSPAIDKGTAAGLTGALTTDQRGTGFARTFDEPSITNAADGADIGAFELNPSVPTPTPTPTPTATPSPTPTPTVTPTPTPTPTPTVPTFAFDSDTYAVDEGVTSVTVRILRSGPSVASAAVDITSEDGTAKQKGDYTLVVGHLVFAAGETEKSFQVLINDDSYAEGFEFATLILQHPENGTLGAQSTATLQITDDVLETSGNPIDDARTFVGTHYHDFLYRQADQAGEDFWTQQIESCGASETCLRGKRVDVSAAFFLSIEFQQTGYLVIRAHKAAFGNLKSNPRYAVFLRDQRQVSEGVIVGAQGWEQKLEANRKNYLEEFVSRLEFLAQFPQGQFAGDYVDTLFQNAGVVPAQAEREAVIAAYGAGDITGRAVALRTVIDSTSAFNRLYNDSFVLMQFYGYLRRNPDDAPDHNFEGYDFWLAKLNSFTLPGEDARDEAVALARVRRAEMVRAFIESAEYRQRFGGSGSNQFVGSVSNDSTVAGGP